MWKHTDRLIRLVTTAGVLVVTLNHPVWNATDHAWQPVAQLESGDRVAVADGGAAQVVETTQLPKGQKRVDAAYNLTVEGLHTYYVGNGIVVHNTCPRASEAGDGGAADAAGAADVLLTPRVGSRKLQNIVDNLYKGTTNPNRVGNGTTMDAIRSELATGEPTSGRMHVTKGQESLRGLEKWLCQEPICPVP